MTILRRINIKIIIYLDDMTSMGHSLEEILMILMILICHKLEKVCVNFSAGIRAFGPDNQLSHFRIFIKQNKNSESSFRTSEFVKQSANINSGVGKVDWLVYINYSSSFTSKVELSFPPNTKNITFIGKLSYLDKIALNENSKSKLKL